MEAARVVKITEYGDRKLGQAMAQGLVAEEMREDVARAIRQAEEARRDNELLRERNGELEAIRREYARVHVEAYSARLREKRLRYDFRYIAWIIVIASAMATLTVASVVLWGLGL